VEQFFVLLKLRQDFLTDFEGRSLEEAGFERSENLPARIIANRIAAWLLANVISPLFRQSIRESYNGAQQREKG